ncbi:unnamed protein product [Parnassius mnemosyne]|uniref:Lipase domain-containing protein n=1 Tax=Parnassius mnemosyne TaxID=213953 RepID=A0AAV1L9Q5_9NEOP
MNNFITTLISYVVLIKAAQQQQINVLDVIGEGIQKDIAPIKQPIDETIADIGSKKCTDVKKILGVAYDQLEGVREPDLNALTILFKTRASNLTYNISEAAEFISEARNFEPSHKLIMFVHGFTDDPTKNSFQNISEAFLMKGEVSVIALDGSSLIRWLYLRSTTYVRFMGRKLGEVLARLVKKGTEPSKIHMIGHSLGSHISGFAGKTLARLTGRRLGRISALDPAGPCFSHVAPELRLKNTDADFVDVIHTDSGVYGLRDPIGHVDYYPNGGSQQPNCLLQTCSHSRAWLYYAESVLENRAFPALKCKDWEAFKDGDCEDEISYMGEGSTPETRGQFYLQTRGTLPYGLGDDGLRYRDQPGLLQSIGTLFG